MTAIERAEDLLAAATAPGCAWCRGEVADRDSALEDEHLTHCRAQRTAESQLPDRDDALRGYIGAVKALLAEHTLTVDWETNQDGTPIASTLSHYNAFRMGQYTTEDCESCQALADFARLFLEEPQE